MASFHSRPLSMSPSETSISTARTLALAGHQGHLTPEQERALEEFRRLVTEAGLYTPANAKTGKAASHTDATLLRFLRARRFEPPKALKQFREREEWGKKINIDSLHANYDLDKYDEAQTLFPRWIGRRDKMGYPIDVYKLGAFTPERMNKIVSAPLEVQHERIAVLHQHLMISTLPVVSTLPSEFYPTPIDGSTTIVDLEGVSFYQMWNLRGHLQQSSEFSMNLFPETMGATWVVNVPSFISTVWGWVQGWYDENTRRKIHILSKSQQTQLLTEIASEDLPTMYGGTLNWNPDGPPNLDAPTREALKTIGGVVPRGPWAFIDGVPVIGKDILAVQNGEVTPEGALKRRLESGDVPKFESYPE